jgi:hypothetical protein
MQDDRCKQLVASIQLLSITEKEELFKLLYKYKCDYTQNNNGVFINLSWCNSELLDIIDHFIHFCARSQNELGKVESQCKELYDTTVQDDPPLVVMPKLKPKGKREPTEEEKEIKTKVSSSMRFYLLRKRFLKNNTLLMVGEDSLTPEEYLCH